MNATPTPPPENTCPVCGTVLPNGLAPEQCPKCLLAEALTTEAATVPIPEDAPPSSRQSRDWPRPGDQFGHYRIARRLGQGGMGAVFEAEDLENGRWVALKVLGQALDSPEARQRFLREGRLAASINHPNSVYVYGTEEIAGTPVIAMELVRGGTLQERVTDRGPLPFAEAVDAILQVIAGLEAAQALGILHRDVKPSNCFEDREGTIKIGDFGLSISTVRTDTNVTAHGTLLGTPAFSSPEQLRSQELNARSDIYSVGVTLFYLLTGRTPFEGHNVVQLIANVLEQPAPSPLQFCPDIPRELARAVVRCLEKQAGERFGSYEELRQALAPFSSTAPVPASLALRFVAGGLDMITVGIFGMAMSLLAFGELLPVPLATPMHSGKMLGVVAASFTLVVLYYALLEGLWGASVGKAICRLRVAGPDRNPPGVPKALVRALAFQILPALPYWISIGFDPTQFFANSSGTTQYALSSLYYLVVGILFCTARKKNGYAALHDLFTNTRVIRRFSYQARPVLLPSAEPAPDTSSQAKVGPYHVLKSLEKTSEGEWLLGYDTLLLRKVWLRVVPEGTPPVPATWRQLGRSGRLRWIAGWRRTGENWDAFEGVTGQPLLRLVSHRCSWEQVRCWLYDLARELHLAEKDGTSPSVLALDRVWITADGRAKLFDFPAPGLAVSPTAAAEQPPVQASANVAAFLSHVARTALEGQPPAEPGTTLKVPLPLSARVFLEHLPGLPAVEAILAGLQPLLHQPAAVSRGRRFALVAGCIAFPVISALGLVFATYLVETWEQKQPGIWELSQLLHTRSSFRQPWFRHRPSPDDRSFAIYIAAHYRSLITDSNQWISAYSVTMIRGGNRAFAEQSVRTYPNPTEEEIETATTAVDPLVRNVSAHGVFQEPWLPLLACGVSLIAYVALPAVLAALCFKGGLILRALRVAVVRRDGRPASRLRVCWRTLLSWAPVLLWPVLLAWLRPSLGAAWAGALLTAFVGGVTLYSLLLPKRSLQDRLAGTFLVPR